MHIANALEKELERQKLATYDIDNLDDILAAIKTDVSIRTIIWQDDGGRKGKPLGAGYDSGIYRGIP
jgi:hypothetical protein